MSSAVRKLLAIDPRSLAAFRIAMGTVLLVDLGIRAADLGAMYTDDGMFSRTTICRYYSVWNWSFHFGSGSWAYQGVLFAFAAVLALALLVGYRTRLVTVASWLMLVSVHNRVPPVLGGPDNLARMLLFWGMFLPLGRIWSVDAWSEERRGIRRAGLDPVPSVATAAILLQMAFMYLFSAIFKSNADWLEGKAMDAILRDGFYGTPIGAGFLEFPGLLSALTVMIVIMEWLCPFLLFCPIRTGLVRLWVLGVLASMHIGVAVLLNVGLFSFVSISGLLLFLPPLFWDKLTSRIGKSARAAGRLASKASPGSASPRVSVAAQGLCFLAFAYVLFENINGLPGRVLPWKPAPKTEIFTVSLGLGQKWDMFERAPSRNGWYVARATLVDGSQVDLLRGGAPVVWDRPRNPAAIYPNERWRKVFVGLSYGEATGYDVFRRPVAEYLCREWNRLHAPEKRVSDFALVFCIEGKDEYDLGPHSTLIRIPLASLEFASPDEKR